MESASVVSAGGVADTPEVERPRDFRLGVSRVNL